MLLQRVRIKNLALVEDLEWEISPGFTAITGETGAGKSIIIGALQLLLGERADKSLVRTGAEMCTVEAIFQGNDFAKWNAHFEESGIEPCDPDLILKRSLSLSGTNRQFINGSPTTLGHLKELGDDLVDLHGPHDHQSLLSPDRQLDLLDAFANAVEARDKCGKVFRRWRPRRIRMKRRWSSYRRSRAISAATPRISISIPSNWPPSSNESRSLSR